MMTSTWTAKIAAAVRLAGRRLRTFIHPNVTVSKVPPNVHADWNLPVKVRDGTTLHVNVFRPNEPGTYPVIMSAHPYGRAAGAAALRTPNIACSRNPNRCRSANGRAGRHPTRAYGFRAATSW